MVVFPDIWAVTVGSPKVKKPNNVTKNNVGKKEKVRINMYQNIRLEHKLDELYKKSLLIETFF